MQTPILKDSYIACPFQIQMLDLQGVISLGTAFFYEHDGENFIITNWHNVVGKHPHTGVRWTRNFGSSALLVKVSENRRKHSRRRRILAIRRTGSMPNFAEMLRSHPVFIKNAGEP